MAYLLARGVRVMQNFFTVVNKVFLSSILEDNKCCNCISGKILSIPTVAKKAVTQFTLYVNIFKSWVT